MDLKNKLETFGPRIKIGETHSSIFGETIPNHKMKELLLEIKKLDPTMEFEVVRKSRPLGLRPIVYRPNRSGQQYRGYKCPCGMFNTEISACVRCKASPINTPDSYTKKQLKALKLEA